MKTNEFRFESLEVYQRSLALSKKIYLLSQSWPKEHLFGITDQFRRATLSVSLNIAEGSSRTRQDFRHFLSISRGSCFECIPLLHLAASLKLLSPQEEQIIYNELISLSQMLSKLRSSLSSK